MLIDEAKPFCGRPDGEAGVTALVADRRSAAPLSRSGAAPQRRRAVSGVSRSARRPSGWAKRRRPRRGGGSGVLESGGPRHPDRRRIRPAPAPTLVAGRSHVLGAYFPSRGIGVFGGAVYLVDYGDLDRTDNNGNTIARIAPRNFEFLASYATSLRGSFVFGSQLQARAVSRGLQRRLPRLSRRHRRHARARFRRAVQRRLAWRSAPHRHRRCSNVGFRLQVQNQAQAGCASHAARGRRAVRAAPASRRADWQHSIKRFDVKLAADLDSPWGQAGAAGDAGRRRHWVTRSSCGCGRGYAVRAGRARAARASGLGIESGSLGVDLARAFLDWLRPAGGESHLLLVSRDILM